MNGEYWWCYCRLIWTCAPRIASNGADVERQTLWSDGPCLGLQWAYWGESVSMTMTRQYRVSEGYEWVLCHWPGRRGHPAPLATVIYGRMTQGHRKWPLRSHCHTHALSLRRCSMEYTASIFKGTMKDCICVAILIALPSAKFFHIPFFGKPHNVKDR